MGRPEGSPPSWPLHDSKMLRRVLWRCVCKSPVGSQSNSDSFQCCHETKLISVFSQIYELRVMETKPDKAVSIIECDMNVSNFAAYSAFHLGRRAFGSTCRPVPKRVSLSHSPQDYVDERGGKCCQSIMKRFLAL